MCKIDYTKPIQFIGLHGLHEATYVGKHAGRHVVWSGQAGYCSVDDEGREINQLKYIYQAPVTHKRWVVLFALNSGDLRATFYPQNPTADNLKVFNKVIAVKEVTLEEGEGL